MQPTDLELWRAAAAGDQGAFHLLVDRHAPALFRSALALSASRSDAEDICQETFVAAFKSLKTFDGRASVKTWLTRILTRRAATLWSKERHARHAVSLDRDVSSQDGARRELGGPLAGEVSVAPSTWVVDQRLDLLEAIRALAPEFRQAITLREIEGLSYQEIADSLGIPRGTVESRIHRARAELRRKLSGY